MIRKEDDLWKGLLDEEFIDFIRFVHPGIDDILDLERGHEFLDKELQQVFPPDNEVFKPKRVDKLVKVYTREGKEEWILLHVEVQARYTEDFAKRMFIYFYRLFDKYQRRISAYAIFTEPSHKARPDFFKLDFMNTELSYRFNTFKIADQTDEELLRSDNPFAIVVLAAKLACKGRNVNKVLDRDHIIKDLKFKLVRHLLAKNFPTEKVRVLLNFIKFYIRFENTDFNAKFDYELYCLINNEINMGLEEQIIDIYSNRGVERGIKQGRVEGRQEGIEISNTKNIHHLILNLGYSMEQVAEILQLSLNYVKKIVKNRPLTSG